MLLRCAGQPAVAQATLHGRVTDQEGNPLPWSNIRALTLPDSAQAAYAFADASGDYTLHLAQPARYLLRFDALAFQALDRPITLAGSALPELIRVDVALFPAPLELEEVTVRAETGIRVGKDTVEIRASAYATGSERVAEDLLKRLPGIEVGADGSIRVRGKAVSKVLIEGDDLFERGYTLLTKNLSAGVIDRVEVLHRYTDNPVLRDLQQPDAVALNLRLKEEVKSTLFGKGFLGGSTETYETDLNLIRVHRRTKAFFLGNLNNSGKDATGDLQALLSPKLPTGATLTDAPLPLTSFLPQPHSQTGLPEMRSRSNNAELASLSGLLNMGKAWKVKGHFYYSGDEHTRGSQSREVFRTDSLVFENTQSQWDRRVLPLQSGRLTVLYTTRKQRLEWVAELQLARFRARQRLLFNWQPVWEDSREPARSAFSRFDYSRRLDSATALQVSLQLGYDSKPRTMRLEGVDWGDLTPGEDRRPMYHSLLNSRKTGSFEASLLRGQGRWQARLLAAYTYQKATFESDFVPQGEEGSPLYGPEFRNRGRNGLSKITGGFHLSYTAPTWSVRGRLHLQNLTNRYRETGTSDTRLLSLVPAFSGSWQPSRAHYIMGSYTYGFRETGLQEHYSGYLPGGFRLLQRGLGYFQTFRSHRWLANYTLGEWGDPHLFTTTFLYSREPAYAGSDSQVHPDLVLSSASSLAGREQVTWNSSYDQYLGRLRSNLKLRAELQVQDYESRYDGQAQQNTLLYWQVGPELRTVFDGGFNAHAGLGWSLSRYRGNALSKSRSQNGFLDLEFRSGAWLLELSNEGYRYRDAGTGRTVWFSDLGVSYAPKDSGFALRIQLANAWNTRYLNKLDLTETGRFENRFALRPRQLVAGLDFRF